MMNVRVVVCGIVLFSLMVENANALYTFANSLLFKDICYNVKRLVGVSIEAYDLGGNLVTKLEVNKNVNCFDVSPVSCELNRVVVLYKRHKKQGSVYWLPVVNDTEGGDKTPFDSRFDTFLKNYKKSA